MHCGTGRCPRIVRRWSTTVMSILSFSTPARSTQFRRLVKENGTEIIRLPPMSPDLNAYAERFVRSIKDECLGRMIFLGQASLRRAIKEFVAHYHMERNHQGLGNRLIRPQPQEAANHGAIDRQQRLGGMLNYYYRAAA